MNDCYSNVNTVTTKPCALCIDLNESLRRLLSQCFEQIGFEVITASTVQEAIARYSDSGPFHLLVTCIYGLQGDALEMGSTIRHQTPDISMIAYAGSISEDLPDKVLQAGFDHFMALPFSFSEMFSNVTASLRMHGYLELAKKVELSLAEK